jgi:hypothetical protein
LPFLVISGTTYFVYNYREVTSRQKKEPPNKRIESMISTVPVANRTVKRLALTSGSGATSADDDTIGNSYGESIPEVPPDTLGRLVTDLFAHPEGDFKSVPYEAAWKLATLMGGSNARIALQGLKLTDVQLSRPRLKWLIRPGDSKKSDDPLNAVQGRIGYLIRAGEMRYAPAPPLAVDPYIAVGLISVREDGEPYHSGCLVEPHDDDVDIINQLYYAGHFRKKDKATIEGIAAPESYIDELTYRDFGRLIRLDLAHTNTRLAAKQANLISHVMRHFLGDELSGLLFDSLSPANQARLAVAMLTASEWATPADWEYWAKTGRDLIHAPKLETASNLSFAAACGLAIGVIVMACWQIVAWVSHGWSWYFSSSHVLGTWPGWLKALSFVILALLCIIWLSRTIEIGAAIAVIALITVLISILASPVVRLHAWIASWGTDSTVVICALIFSAFLAWLGVFYSDRIHTEEPVQFSVAARGKFSQICSRSRFRPTHVAGHEEWCAISRNLGSFRG